MVYTHSWLEDHIECMFKRVYTISMCSTSRSGVLPMQALRNGLKHTSGTLHVHVYENCIIVVMCILQIEVWGFTTMFVDVHMSLSFSPT